MDFMGKTQTRGEGTGGGDSTSAEGKRMQRFILYRSEKLPPKFLLEYNYVIIFDYS
jgi:hypothetical protein